MTNSEKEKILKLRISGLGYKSIATKLGLSRDCVRQFCKTNNIAGYANAMKVNRDEQESSGAVCLNCTAELEQPTCGRKKKFCSDKCRNDWWNKNYELHNFKTANKYICAECKKVFTAYGNRKFCSHECYVNYRFGGQQLTK